MEQHHHELLCASWSPLGVNAPSRLHLTHSPVCVGQSFVTLPRFRCQKTPAIHCHSQPNSSSPWLEKSGILYVHIYLPAVGLLQLARFPPAPTSSASLVPRQGQLEDGPR